MKGIDPERAGWPRACRLGAQRPGRHTIQALESGFLEAADGQVGLMVGDGVSQFFVYPARVRSSGEFTRAVIHVTDVRAAVEQMRGRGVQFEEYDTPETRTENGIARMPGGGEAAWFKDSESNLVGLVRA
jgi:hypothetical protein